MSLEPQHRISHLGNISAIPPDTHVEMLQNELLACLRKAGSNWTNENISDAISILFSSDEFSLSHAVQDETKKNRSNRDEELHTFALINENTVKSWFRNDIKYAELGGMYRQALFELIQKHSDTEAIATAWIRAITECCIRGKPQDISKPIGEAIRSSHKLTHLPALFETDRSLPLTVAYVDLSISMSQVHQSAPNLLELNQTLAEKINKRIEARYAIRKEPQDYLDQAIRKTTLILGAPGSGKSSLLRQIALDIAKNKYKHLKTPLFVEARNYWASKQNNPQLDLITFALQDLFPLGKDIETLKKSLAIYAKYSKKKVVILFDGLDEIAGNEQAVEIIYNDLRKLNNSDLSLIITSRPAGLVGELGENQRCDMVDFDHESIECLIDNWGKRAETINVEKLKLEIFGSSALVDMSRNPFLLTVLCYLKSEIPDQNLPQSRIGVYETLMELITLQAQRRNRSVLRPDDVQQLAAFCLYLYKDCPNGPMQIFKMSHWNDFVHQSQVNTVSFSDNILPARLLNIWNDASPYYHFLHLSIHEYLAAYAMIDKPLSEVMSLRFSPIWRNVFCFYAAFLYTREMHNEFKLLVNTLYENQDINGLTLKLIADIFSYAGIRDTKLWFGDDLQDSLYFRGSIGDYYQQEVMLDALSTLDPAWLEKSELEHLDDELTRYYACDADEALILESDDHECPFERLAKAKTTSAKKTIEKAFWGDNHIDSILSAPAYALLSTPKDRAKIIKYSKETDDLSGFLKRLIVYIKSSKRKEFLPVLKKIILNYEIDDAHSYYEIINTISDIGGQESADILSNIIYKEAKKIKLKNNRFLSTLNAALKLESYYVIGILSSLLKMSEIDSTDEFSLIEALMLCLNKDLDREKLSQQLSHYKLNEIIRALSMIGNNHNLVNDDLFPLIISLIDKNSLGDIENLCGIERKRLASGARSLMGDFLLEVADTIYSYIKNINKYSGHPSTITMALIFDVLADSQWEPAKQIIRDVLVDNKLHHDLVLMQATFNLTGTLFKGSKNIEIIDCIKNILYGAGRGSSEAATIAIGKIDIEELYRISDADKAYEAMGYISAQEDIMIFEDFWVTTEGQCITWKNPPQKLLFLHNESDKHHHFVCELSHETSRYGLVNTTDPLSDCVACVVIESSQETTQADYADLLTSYIDSKENPKLFKIHDESTEDEMKEFAAQIGSAISSSL